MQSAEAQGEGRRRRRLKAFGLVLAALLPLSSLGLLVKEYQRTNTEARANAMVLADGVEKQLRDRLTLVAMELDGLARISDPRERELAAARQTIPLFNLHMQEPANDPGTGRARLTLAPPVLKQGRWRVPVGRRLADGRWLHGEVNGSLFVEVVTNYSLPPGQLLDLLHEEGVLLARSIDSERYVGRRLAGKPALTDPLYASASGSFTRVGFDGVERLKYYRRLAGLPLVIEVGTPRYSVLLQWAPFAVLTLALSLLIASAWWWVLKGFDRQQLRQQGLISELEQSRQREDAAEAQYRFLFEHNPLPMWVFDLETLRFLAVNEAMVHHYGYGRERLLSMTLLDIRPAAEAEATRVAVQVASDQHTIGAIWTHLRADGTPMRMATQSHDIEFQGRAARLVAAEDVTERERSEQRFRLIARATSDAIWDWDVITGELWWSDSFYTQFGYRPVDMQPTLEGWKALIHPDDAERVVSRLEQAASSGRMEWQDSYRFRRKEGSYAEVLDRGFFLRDARGQALRAAGGMLDLTQTLQDQSSLRLLRRAVDSTANGIVIADARQPDYPVVYVNRGFTEITGYPAEEVLGRNCRLLQRDDQSQPGLEALRIAMREGGEAQVLLRNYRADGTLFFNEFHLSPVRNEQGTLTHFIGVINDVSQRRHFEEQLAHRATHDELTGLPNRQLLHDRLHQAILNADRYGRQAAVVFIDLDDFKLVNDNLGHSAGDTVLRIVAQRLREVVRDTDTVGRVGGDEFVVVLTEQTDEAGMALVIERVSAALSQPMEVAGLSHTLTPSIGWCRYPDAGTDAETLLMRADVAMYQAKRSGRNRAVAYRAEFDVHASQRLRLLGELREALRLKQFELVFQPLFNRAGGVVALEALVRWQHPERGLLAPAEFIGVCEDSGLIVELGRRVLLEAARHHCLLAEAGLGRLRIAVNVSALQFEQGLADDVRAALAQHAMPAGALELELTESAIMHNFDRAIGVMQELAALGVTFSVDDFGTGHSSLAYLQRLPIDRLKIDRSFVKDLGAGSDDATICASIIGLAHSLKLETVAEGVETQEQLAWLREKGCDEVQGYLLGRPQAFDALLPTLLVGEAALAG